MAKSVIELLKEAEENLAKLSADMAAKTAELAAAQMRIGELEKTVATLKDEAKDKPEDKSDDDEDKPEDKPEEDKDKDKPEEDKDKDKEDEDEAEDEDEKEKAFAALSARVVALETAIKSGSMSGVPEGGTGEPKGEMTRAQALAAYNKIDPNDAVARAAFRAKHAALLGLKR